MNNCLVSADKCIVYLNPRNCACGSQNSTNVCTADVDPVCAFSKSLNQYKDFSNLCELYNYTCAHQSEGKYRQKAKSNVCCFLS